MKLRPIVVALAVLAMAGNVFAQDLSSDKGKLSYYFGYDFGNDLAQLTANGEQLDVNTVVKGLQDAIAKREPGVNVDQLRPVMEAFQQRQQQRQQRAKAEYDRLAAENKTKSDRFLSENRAKTGVQTLAGGIQYKVLEAGSGAKPTLASTVALEVTGPFLLGERPAEAQQPQAMDNLKLSEVEMQGMKDALLQMPNGAKWEITLPPEKAFGADPQRGFPPNVAVVFEVKLVNIR